MLLVIVAFILKIRYRLEILIDYDWLIKTFEFSQPYILKI